MFYFKRNGIYYFEYQNNGRKKRVTTKARTIEDAKRYVEQKFFNIETAPLQQFSSSCQARTLG